MTVDYWLSDIPLSECELDSEGSALAPRVVRSQRRTERGTHQALPSASMFSLALLLLLARTGFSQRVRAFGIGRHLLT